MWWRSMPKSAPRSLRATLAIVAMSGVPVGGTAAGFAAAALIPHFGWPILFEVGGIVPIVVALAAIIGMPESIKFMALHDSRGKRMARLVAAIRPDLPANARFVIEDEKQSPGSNPVYLFRNGLWLITPLSWLMFVLNLMGFFFLRGYPRRQMLATSIACRRRSAQKTPNLLTMCYYHSGQPPCVAVMELFLLGFPA